MSKVFTAATMSLDGYIAGPGESGFEHLFAWYGNGDVEVPTEQPDRTFRMSRASADYWAGLVGKARAGVIGRRLFDLTDGWGGVPPAGGHVVVLTHEVPAGWPRADAPFTFVTEGIERAVEVAREHADGGWVEVNGGTIASQCLDAGLLDELHIELVPVLLGGGVPFFAGLGTVPVLFDGPTIVEGNGVTHLRYTLRR